MLELLGGGALAGPQVVELLEAFQNSHARAQDGRAPPAPKLIRASQNELCGFHLLVALLVEAALGWPQPPDTALASKTKSLGEKEIRRVPENAGARAIPERAVPRFTLQCSSLERAHALKSVPSKAYRDARALSIPRKLAPTLQILKFIKILFREVNTDSLYLSHFSV